MIAHIIYIYMFINNSYIYKRKEEKKKNNKINVYILPLKNLKKKKKCLLN